jgi:hypothetical protein
MKFKCEDQIFGNGVKKSELNSGRYILLIAGDETKDSELHGSKHCHCPNLVCS